MSGSSKKRLGRRGVLVGVGLAATEAAVLAAGVSSPAQARAQPSPGSVPSQAESQQAESQQAMPQRQDVDAAHGLAAADAEIERLFGPLRPGCLIGQSWRLEEVYAVRAGSIPVVLSAADGERFAVEIFRSEAGEPAPPGQAGPLSLYLHNRGSGSSRTPEKLGLGVQALAAALRARLQAGAPLPGGLYSHRERRARHPAGIFHVPLRRLA